MCVRVSAFGDIENDSCICACKNTVAMFALFFYHSFIHSHSVGQHSNTMINESRAKCKLSERKIETKNKGPAITKLLILLLVGWINSRQLTNLQPVDCTFVLSNAHFNVKFQFEVCDFLLQSFFIQFVWIS